MEYMSASIRSEYFVGNKVKGRISKPVLQENKVRQIFRKTNLSYPLICTRTISGSVIYSVGNVKEIKSG